MRKIYVLIGMQNGTYWISSVFSSLRKAIKYKNILEKEWPDRTYDIQTEILL